jgi:hypothetical protein
MQSTLHNYTEWSARGENRHYFALSAIGKEARQAAIYASAKLLPGFHIPRRNLSMRPHGDYRFEQSLKIGAFLGFGVGVLQGSVQFADFCILFQELRKALRKHSFAMEFVKLFHGNRLGKLQAASSVRVTDNSSRFLVALGRPSANTVKHDSVPRPILSQQAALRFSKFRELIVILRKKGSLRVTNQE